IKGVHSPLKIKKKPKTEAPSNQTVAKPTDKPSTSGSASATTPNGPKHVRVKSAHQQLADRLSKSLPVNSLLPKTVQNSMVSLPIVLRHRYLKIIADECVKLDVPKGKEVAVEEEARIAAQSHSKSGYLNACALLVKRFRDGKVVDMNKGTES